MDSHAYRIANDMPSASAAAAGAATAGSSRRRNNRGLARLAQSRGLIPAASPDRGGDKDNDKDSGTTADAEVDDDNELDDSTAAATDNEDEEEKPLEQPLSRRSRSSQEFSSSSSSRRNTAQLLNNWSAGAVEGGGCRRLQKLETRMQRRFDSSASFGADSNSAAAAAAAAAAANTEAASSISTSSVASSMLRRIPTAEARSDATANFLHGAVCGGGGMLGTQQLQALLPDRQLLLVAVTWNMAAAAAGAYPTTLESLLFPADLEFVPDVYSVCVQECTPDHNEFLLRCQATLGPSHVPFSVCRHGALLLAVFLRRDLVWFVSIPDTAVLTTRAAIATKGCVAVSFNIFGSSILLINCHFKPDIENAEARLEDYRKIITQLDLPKFTKTLFKSDDVTERFDLTVWAGDLNCRIFTGFGERSRIDAVLQSPRHDLHEKLMARDELKMAQAEGRMFQHFQEGDIRFAPTYKFDIGTDTYDTSNKQRIPSFTDRILFRCRQSGTAKVTAYNSITGEAVRCSDHRPVFAALTVTVKPGTDNIPLAYGSFHHSVYVAGNRRRAMQLDMEALKRIRTASDKKSSRVCSLM